MTDARFPLHLPGHALTNLAGTFLSVDDRFCEIVKAERRQIIGRTIMDITRERDRPMNKGKLAVLRESSTPFVIRKSYLRGDGAVQPVENFVSLLTDGLSGEVISATVHWRPSEPEPDVAELAITAKVLLQEEQRLHRSQSLPSFGWRLLLAAYVLEAEGAELRVDQLCEMADLPREACVFQVWTMVSAGTLTVDGAPTTLIDSGVRLSVDSIAQVERYLRSINNRSNGI